LLALASSISTRFAGLASGAVVISGKRTLTVAPGFIGEGHLIQEQRSLILGSSGALHAPFQTLHGGPGPILKRANSERSSLTDIDKVRNQKWDG